MSLLLIIVVFVTVVLAVFAFGAAAVTPSSVLGARLRALGGQQSQPAENKPAIRERIEQALDPISKAIPLSPSDVSRTRRWLIQAGFRDAIDVNYYFGSRVLMAAIGFVGVILFSGFDNPFLLAGIPGLGFFLPRFILKRIDSRPSEPHSPRIARCARSHGHLRRGRTGSRSSPHARWPGPASRSPGPQR